MSLQNWIGLDWIWTSIYESIYISIVYKDVNRVHDLQKPRIRWRWSCRRQRRQSCQWDGPQHGLVGKEPCLEGPCMPRSLAPRRLQSWTAHTAASGSPDCPVLPQIHRISLLSHQILCSINHHHFNIKQQQQQQQKLYTSKSLEITSDDQGNKLNSLDWFELSFDQIILKVVFRLWK